jgi:hypothetical protein
MTIPIWAYAAVGSLLAGTLAGWTVRDWKADSDALAASQRAQRQYEAKVIELADASLRYEALAQSLRTDERRDRETIREIYREKTLPAECAAPASAVSLLNNAVDRANAAASGKPVSAVPPAP